MKKYLKYLVWIILIIITVAYTYYFRPLVDDELFNYGFAKNILDGLIPYKDFNMIIPPLFTYLLAFILDILGKKLIVYHIVIAIFITIITYLSSKNIGKVASIPLYIILLIYPYTGYNMFCLFLLFILLNVKESKYSYIIEAILISCMFLSKQSLGLLVIPSLIYSKQRKKTFLIYLVVICLFLLYLLINNSIYQFFDYGLFGMFDFADKNGTGINFLFIVECFIIISLIYLVIKTKRKDIFYILMFQVITLPIVNYCHFFISFAPVLYLIYLKIHHKLYLIIPSIALIASFFVFYNIFLIKDDIPYLEPYKVQNFMEGRVASRITSSYIFKIKEIIDEKEEYRPYILGLFSYLIKLNNDMPITKYDLINDGNMGYQGSKKYIEEIDNYCKKEKCLFVINDEENKSRINQTNHEILDYVQENYIKQYSSNIFSIYTN